MAVHKEKAFEDLIAETLVHNGWVTGDPTRWNRQLALDTDNLLAFLAESQPKKWQRLVASHGDNIQERFLSRLTRELDARRTIDVLRPGLGHPRRRPATCV